MTVTTDNHCEANGKKSDRNNRHGLILLSRFYNDYYTLPQQNFNIFFSFQRHGVSGEDTPVVLSSDNMD